MKKNLKFYSHMVTSHNHWKFKTLRRKYDWAGEGKFWALNNLIAESDYCRLDLSEEERKMAIAVELDFDIDEFSEYLKYLEEKCKLIWSENGFIMTDKTQEIFYHTDGKRVYNRDRKAKNSVVAENKEVVAENKEFVAENKEVVAHFEQTKLNKTKLKETKQIQGDFLPENLGIKLPFETDSFLASWNEWKVYKKQEHKFSYKSPTSEQAGLKNLFELSGGQEKKAVAIIQQSLSNGWKGLFQLKNQSNGFHKKDLSGGYDTGTKDESVYDNMK